MPKKLREGPYELVRSQISKVPDNKAAKQLYPEYDKYSRSKDKLILSDTKKEKENEKIINDIFNYLKEKELNNNSMNRKELTTKKRYKEIIQKEQRTTMESFVEILKNNKIDQIIVAGENKSNGEAIKNNPNSKEKIFTLKPDLDAYTALYVLNNFNNKKELGDIYNEGAITSAIGKNGNGLKSVEDKKVPQKFLDMKGIQMKDYNEEKNKQKIRLFIDVGGKWPTVTIEQNGELKTLYIDHHGPGQRDPTSGTKMIIELMEKAGILKELPPWFKQFTDFVNDIDNLSYIEKTDEKGRKIFTENYFRNEWPNTLYALAEKKIPFETLMKMCEGGVITDMERPFTKEELEGEIGQTKIGEFTIKELCQQQKEEVKEVIEGGIKNSISNNKKQGLQLEKTKVGKIIYHNFFIKKNRKANVIPNHLAFKATKAKGYDTYISFDKQNKRGFINTLNPYLSSIVEKLNIADPGCAVDIRGVMATIQFNNLTEEEFLNIVDPNILKDSNLNKNKKEELPKLEELPWTKEEAQKELDEILLRLEDRDKKIKEIDEKLIEMKIQNEKENQPFSFNIEFIKNKIEEIIANNKGIKKIEGLSIIPGANNELILEVKKITAEFNILFTFTTDITIKNAHIINSGSGIILNDGYEITATNYEKKVKNIMAKNINKINDEIIKIIEKELNKKVEKIWIENGELKAL